MAELLVKHSEEEGTDLVDQLKRAIMGNRVSGVFQDMQLGTRNHRCHLFRLGKWNDPIMPTMQDQGAHGFEWRALISHHTRWGSARASGY
jgi:hypothetical protein